MDQIRIDVWDLVFRSGPQSISQIAETLPLEPREVEAAVDHAWFTLQNDIVSIAETSTTQASHHA